MAKFGSLVKDIEETRAKLSVFYDDSPSAHPDTVRIGLETYLHELLARQETYWKQRSRVMWLAEGDMNTKFFHQQASNRRKKNTIKGLFNSQGAWCTEDKEMEDIVISYFSELFSSSNPSGIDEVLTSIPSLITEDMNVQLSREVDSDEVLKALKQMHRSKAPGPDGFSPGFYPHFWKVVGVDVVAAVKTFILSDYSMRKINGTHITLIPKKTDPKTMSELRPISLCNVLYKLGSKVLANRLKVILPSVISHFQSAFVPGRLISDNSLVAFEVAHFLKK